MKTKLIPIENPKDLLPGDRSPSGNMVITAIGRSSVTFRDLNRDDSGNDNHFVIDHENNCVHWVREVEESPEMWKIDLPQGWERTEPVVGEEICFYVPSENLISGREYSWLYVGRSVKNNTWLVEPGHDSNDDVIEHFGADCVPVRRIPKVTIELDVEVAKYYATLGVSSPEGVAMRHACIEGLNKLSENSGNGDNTHE